MSYPSTETLSLHCRLILDGDGWEQYDHSSYKVLAAVLGGAHRAGWHQDEALALVRDKTHRFGAHAHAKWGGSLYSQFASKWRAVCKKHDAHNAKMTEWLNTLLTYWPLDGRHGAKLRVATALAVSAHQSGSLTFTKSQRNLGEIAGVGYASEFATHSDTTTVRKALTKLEEIGVFTSHSREAETTDQEMFSAMVEYTLSEPYQLRSRFLDLLSTETPTKHSSSAHRWISGVVSAQQTWLHPVFEHNGLGMAACRVWHLLATAAPLSVVEVQNVTRLSRSGVHKALRALEESRLVTRSSGRTWSAQPRDLDDVAEELGVLLRGEFRTRANQQHRINRKRALLSGRSAQRVRSQDQNSPFDPAVSTSVMDPFTGEVFHDSTVQAAAVLLGAALERAPEPSRTPSVNASDERPSPFDAKPNSGTSESHTDNCFYVEFQVAA